MSVPPVPSQVPAFLNAPFVDQNGILMPWARAFLQLFVASIGGEGGLSSMVGFSLPQLPPAASPFFPPVIQQVSGSDIPAPAQSPRGILTLANGAQVSDGIGSPAGVLPGNVGDLYLRRDGGAATTLYVKESGAGTTAGWTGK